MRKALKKPNFWCGIGIGILVCMIFDIIGIYMLLEKGITICIDTSEVAMTVQKEVEKNLRTELPDIVEETKKDIPIIVKKELKGKLGDTKIEVGKIKLTLPKSFSEHLESELQSFTIRTLNNMIDHMDTGQLAQEISRQSYRMVKETLRRELNGKTFIIAPSKWIRMPITVITKN